MITPSFGITATERVLPKLALDFTTANLDPRITFTRSGATATQVNSNGYIESVAANTPRFDFDPVTKICKGLLIEETRDNLQRYSIPINNGYYDFTRSSIVDNQIVSPDGTQNGPKISCTTTSTSGMNITAPVCTIASGATITGSIYLKKGYDDWAAVVLYDGSANGVRQYFNVNTGTTGSSAAFGTGWAKVSAKIEPAGSSYYRCIFTVTTTGTSAKMIVTASCAGDGNLLGTAGVTYGYPWGLQIEQGTFATSYIPTTTTALTRNADVATITGANFSDWFNATAGSANVSVTPKSTSGTRPLFQMDDSTASNIISLRGNVANPELYIKATTDQAQIDAGTIVANTAYKLAGAWNTNNCAAAQNGNAAVIDTSATIPTVTQARIGSDGTNYANAWLQKINYWPQRITNNEVQAFSK